MSASESLPLPGDVKQYSLLCLHFQEEEGVSAKDDAEA